MRKITFLSGLSILFSLIQIAAFSQNNKEKEIRDLEKLEGESWVKKDSMTLFKLFAPELVVNTPLNRVANLPILKQLMRAGKIDISASEKIIEKISFIQDMGIAMGHDIIKPERGMENAGKTVTRQYTDVWKKYKKSWRLIIRQATIIAIK